RMNLPRFRPTQHLARRNGAPGPAGATETRLRPPMRNPPKMNLPPRHHRPPIGRRPSAIAGHFERFDRLSFAGAHGHDFRGDENYKIALFVSRRAFNAVQLDDSAMGHRDFVFEYHRKIAWA